MVCSLCGPGGGSLKWGLVGGLRSLGTCLWVAYWEHGPFHSAWLPWGERLTPCDSAMMFCLATGPKAMSQATGDWNFWNWAKINLIELIIWGALSVKKLIQLRKWQNETHGCYWLVTSINENWAGFCKTCSKPSGMQDGWIFLDSLMPGLKFRGRSILCTQ